MVKKIFMLMRSVAGIVTTLGLSSCSGLKPCCPVTSKFNAYEIHVETDETVRNISLRVHLAGIDDYSILKNINTDQYWEKPIHIAKELKFGRNAESVQIISIDDPLWKTWKDTGATRLLIVSDMPGTYSVDTGDPRKLVLPLDRRCWRGKIIKVRLRKDGIIPSPSPYPVCSN
jgi:hypothetical protein